MLSDDPLLRANEAIRALTAVQAMLTDAASDGADKTLDALTVLEAARAAGNHVAMLVTSLTARALGAGASFRSMGFPFDDPRD